MALVHCDGFALWTSLNSGIAAGKCIYGPYGSSNTSIGTTGYWPTNSNGRWGAGSGSFGVGTDYGVLNLPSMAISGGFVMGFAFAKGGWWSRNGQVLGGLDTWYLDANAGMLRAYCGGVLRVTIDLPPGWCFIELKALPADASNLNCEIRVDGYTWWSGTVVGTPPGTIEPQFGPLFTQPNHADMSVADIYILSGASAPNDFLGDVRIETLIPTAEGSDTGWSVGAGASKTAAVADVPADADPEADYIVSSTTSAIQTFQLGDMVSSSGTVHGVMVSVRARKESSPPRGFAPVVRLGGTVVQGPVVTLPGSLAYAVYKSAFVTKPDGGAWSIADVNALQAGVQVTT